MSNENLNYFRANITIEVNNELIASDEIILSLPIPKGTNIGIKRIFSDKANELLLPFAKLRSEVSHQDNRRHADEKISLALHTPHSSQE